jgi:very-short-patch-repair endonuclease
MIATGSNSPLPEGCPQDGVLFNTPTQNNTALTKSIQLKIRDIILVQNPITQLPYNPNLKLRARKLRQAENLSEVLFWTQVTKGNFHKIDFDRQRVIGNYIVDFYIKKLGLVIEIDGSSHDNKIEYDKVREEYLIGLGLKVYRISVSDIMSKIPMVMAALEDYIVEHYGAK